MSLLKWSGRPCWGCLPLRLATATKAELHGGALVLVPTLFLALVLASAKDRSDRLLAGGMVRGDVEQVTDGMGLHTAELVDQGLAGCPREEHADDVRVDDIRKGVALL